MDFTSVFNAYERQYRKILCRFYPAKNSTGFAERNLSVNWSKALESTFPNDTIISWFEYQFGESNNKHLDALIWNETTGDLFLVESKRYNNPKSKVKEVFRDAVRINTLNEEIISEARLPEGGVKHCYGVILADIWPKKTGRGRKRQIFEAYRSPSAETSFLQTAGKYIDDPELLKDFNCLPMNEIRYYVSEFHEVSECEDYDLVSLVWKL